MKNRSKSTISGKTGRFKYTFFKRAHGDSEALVVKENIDRCQSINIDTQSKLFIIILIFKQLLSILIKNYFS